MSSSKTESNDSNTLNQCDSGNLPTVISLLRDLDSMVRELVQWRAFGAAVQRLGGLSRYASLGADIERELNPTEAQEAQNKSRMCSVAQCPRCLGGGKVKSNFDPGPLVGRDLGKPCPDCKGSGVRATAAPEVVIETESGGLVVPPIE